MLRHESKFGLGKVAAVATVALASVVVTGCRTYPYSILENEVYDYVNRFGGKIPRGFVLGKYEVEGGPDVLYHDYSLVLQRDKGLAIRYADGRGRYVGRRLYNGYEDLLVGYFDVEPLKKWWESKEKGEMEAGSFVGFAVRSASGDDASAVVEKAVLLTNPEGGVMYAKGKGERQWKMCDKYNIRRGYDLDGAWDACVELGTEDVAEGQVRRYLRLADRFYETYFSREQ